MSGDRRPAPLRGLRFWPAASSASRHHIVPVALVACFVVVAIGWMGFARSGGAMEVRRALVDSRRLPWPAQTVGGRITDARAWDSELPSIQLTVLSDDGRDLLLVLNDSTTVRGGEISSIPDLFGKRVSANAKVLLPWPSPEYFVQTLTFEP